MRADFGPADSDFALALLADWRISYVEEPPVERLVAAAVLFADGDIDALDQAFALAEADWRDLLVSADLATDDWPRRLDVILG